MQHVHAAASRDQEQGSKHVHAAASRDQAGSTDHEQGSKHGAPRSVPLIELLLRVVEKAKEYDDALYAHRRFSDRSPEDVLLLLGEGQAAQVSMDVFNIKRLCRLYYC